MFLRPNVLVGAIKLTFLKDAKCDVFLDQCLVTSGQRVHAKKPTHICCGCLSARTIRVAIYSKQKLEIDSIEVLGRKQSSEEPLESDLINALILNI